ncbi:Homeodomain-like protein [Cyathus striatus]|nr:Homeodomain-like protein [Cyathus striatus]
MLPSDTPISSMPLLDSTVFSFASRLDEVSNLRPDSVNIKVLMEQDSRKRRQWTEEEDDALREAVHIEHPEGGAPYKWLEIARHIPGRSNKDCRKRWYNKMSSPQTLKGGWSPEEDALLTRAVKRYGTKWPLVAAMVAPERVVNVPAGGTIPSIPTSTKRLGQERRLIFFILLSCISNWPNITGERLITAVNEHGKKWSYISKTCFPRRTGLAAKNR